MCHPSDPIHDIVSRVGSTNPDSRDKRCQKVDLLVTSKKSVYFFLIHPSGNNLREGAASLNNIPIKIDLAIHTFAFFLNSPL